MKFDLKTLIRRLFRRGRFSPEDVVQIRPDTPIADPRDDRLGFAVFAEALVDIIDSERTATPLTIALSAPWGAGKTSVARMVETLLERRVAAREGERPRLTCWFNAWEHSDAPHLGAALAARVAHEAGHNRARWRRLVSPLPSAMLGPHERWRRRLGVALAAVVGAALLVALHRTRDLAEHTLHLDKAFIDGLGWLGLLWIGALAWPVFFSAGKDAARFLDDPRSEAAKGLMSQVSDQLGGLIRRGRRGGRMVIFVDDLERCPARRAVEVFEVASQLLAHEGVVTILLADMRAISDAARAAYESESGRVDVDLGRRYLEKLVQLELELPPPTRESMLRLLEPDRRRVRDRERNRSWLSRQISEFNATELQSWSASAVGVAVLAGAIATLSSSLLSGTSNGGGGELFSILGFIAATAGIAAVVGTLAATVVRRRRQQERREVRDRLREAPDGRRQASELLDERKSERLESYAEQEVRTYDVDYSAEVEAVEAFIRRYLPRTPRSAKRMLNHARLLTKICRDRGMFGRSTLEPAHLGKWIVLRERWPHLAEALAEPGALQVVEDIEIPALKPDENQGDEELHHLLRDKPEIAAVINRLIYFEAE